MAPRFLAKKKMSYFAGYIAKEIVKEEVVTEKFSRAFIWQTPTGCDVTLLIVLMHGYLMIFATDKIWLSDRIRQKIVNNNNDNNNNNTDNNTLSIR